HELAVRHRKRNAVDGGYLAEFLDDIPGQYRCHRTSSKPIHRAPPPIIRRSQLCSPTGGRSGTAAKRGAVRARPQVFPCHFVKIASACWVAHLTESSADIWPLAAFDIMSQMTKSL